ncbi:MAG: hypothetical protein ABSE73_18085 [Planctomycetota bacterium]
MRYFPLSALAILLAGAALAASGDPQLKTDHPWYPGELACSTFERLFKTQAELYTRVTGRPAETDEDKALAAWYWRNLHYAHAEEGAGDLWGKGFGKGGDQGGDGWTREYWTGLFAHGFGICGTTHSQWTAEMERLLGHCRARVAGVGGHNSFEVYLAGGPYKDGQWALLDHDICTVIFSTDGSRLLSIPEVKADLNTLKNPAFKPERQRGWRVAGLADSDAAVYSSYGVAEYLGGYSAAPPIVQLRAGESVRRWLKPGLEDGKTFVFWGLNYKAGGVPGPERSRTWINQPEKMYGSTKGTGWVPGQVRFGNAVYTYTPDFKDGSYKEGAIEDAADKVAFEFYTPYVIGCTPPNAKPWGVYDAGGKNGLVLHGKMTCPVQISVDQGKTWLDGGACSDGLDLTDLVKGRQQYWIRFGAGAQSLADSGLSLRTVCQANMAVMPRLHDGANKITFLASGLGVLSAGPNKSQAAAHLVGGKFGSDTVTLELATPRKEKAVRLYAAAWVASGSPPQQCKYQIEYSVDGEKSWQSVVKDWDVLRHPPEPPDFWSQSMCWGDAALEDCAGPVRVRFRNDGGRAYLKAEAHLVYKVQQSGPTEAAFGWKEEDGPVKTASHVFAAEAGKEDSTWVVEAGPKVETLWAEFTAK